ncbi:MAG: hypothetical protein LBO78_04010 [Rickettsiales bacterium]|jgi:hypothetical protein|nr:hypothetical protein [Rickettsiales bacterium]
MSGTWLGFFYHHTKKFLSVWLSIVVISAFVSSFLRELDVYKRIGFSIHPLEIMTIGVIDAVFMTVQLFVPVLIAVLLLKVVIMIGKGIPFPRLLKRSLKKQVAISLIVAALFGGLFYANIAGTSGASLRLARASGEIFLLEFMSVLFTLTSMYGLMKGFAPIVIQGRK